MKKLNRNEVIAVFAGLAFITYLMFSGPLVALFNPSSNNQGEQNNQMTQSGVATQDMVVGTGDVAERGDVLTVHYVGTLTDGKVFDSSLDRNAPINFTLGAGQVIRGWDEGLLGMRVGGKRVLTIQPDYGYGSAGVGPIPPNSTLIFEVELLNVQKPASTGQ